MSYFKAMENILHFFISLANNIQIIMFTQLKVCVVEMVTREDRQGHSLRSLGPSVNYLPITHIVRFIIAASNLGLDLGFK